MLTRPAFLGCSGYLFSSSRVALFCLEPDFKLSAFLYCNRLQALPFFLSISWLKALLFFSFREYQPPQKRSIYLAKKNRTVPAYIKILEIEKPAPGSGQAVNMGLVASDDSLNL